MLLNILAREYPPRSEKPLKGSPALFKNKFIDTYLSRIKPWQVLTIWVPIGVYFVYLSIISLMSFWQQMALALLGALVWSFFEYAYHRFFEHFTPRNAWQEELNFLIHGVHHQYPWDPDRLVMPPIFSVPLGVLIYYTSLSIFGTPYMYPFFASMVFSYLFYDMTHYATHHIKPKTALGRYLRDFHLLHHFKTPQMRYGVSSPLWDYILGTIPRSNDPKNQ